VKLWTVAEARAYLPRLRELVALVQDAAVPSDDPFTLLLRDGSEHAEAALEELHEQGIILRQLPNGLVDFPSPADDGDVRFLCWKTDEADIEWWHRPEDGFAGRQRLAD
jgi:hypothetical protein